MTEELKQALSTIEHLRASPLMGNHDAGLAAAHRLLSALTQRPAAQTEREASKGATPEPVGERISRAEAMRLINALIEGDTLPTASMDLLRDLARPAAAPAVPMTDEQIEPMFNARKAIPTQGEKDAWYWYAWGVSDSETAHGLAAAQAKGGV